MFSNKILIEISGLSSRTFYRRLDELKNQKIITEEKKYLFDDDRAQRIADAMGFRLSFDNYLNTQRSKA